MTDDIQYEPIRGLPETPPEGERILWQGSPDWKALAVDVFHVRAVFIYGAILIAWRTITILHDGGTLAEAGIVALWLLMLPIGAGAILSVLAWATASSTVYTITDKRLAMRIGIALTVTLNLPFRSIVSANYKPSWFGTGDIALTLPAKERISYLVLWPHARHWGVKHPQPRLRGVPDCERVANLLARSLAAATHQTARQVEGQPARTRPADAARPAALAG